MKYENKAEQRFVSKTLAEYECALKTLSDEDLLLTFDKMGSIVLAHTGKDADLAAQGLDLAAHEMYLRRLHKAH
jgi:hypothetical protein